MNNVDQIIIIILKFGFSSSFICRYVKTSCISRNYEIIECRKECSFTVAFSNRKLIDLSHLKQNHYACMSNLFISISLINIKHIMSNGLS